MKTIKYVKQKCTQVVTQINNIWNSVINLKYIQKLFYFLPHNFFLFLLFLVSLVLIITFDYNRYIPIYTYSGTVENFYDPILDNSLIISLDKIDQNEFEDIDKNPDKVCFLFATYNRKSDAVYTYIVHKNNEIVYEEKFNSKHLEDAKFSCFALPGATKENLAEYKLEIAPTEVDMSNMVTIFKDSKTESAAIRLVSESTAFPFKTTLVGVFFFVSTLLNYVINKKKLATEKIWLILSVLYIIPITIINPPYEVPDEPIHFYNAYRLTQFDKDKSFYENLDNEYMTMPESISCLGYANIQKRDKVLNPQEVVDCFKNSNNTIKKSSYVFVEAKIAFFASALGIKVADMITNSPGIIFYMGRLFAALFSIFIIYKALKIAPKHKELLLLVATIPMFIQQMASYSYDAALNTFSVLAIAILLKMIYDKNANRKACTCILLLCGMFIANIKILYLPIFLFLLFVSDEKFNRKIDKYIYTFAIMISSYFLGNLSKGLINSGDINMILSSLFALISMGIVLKFILDEKNTHPKIFLPLLGILIVGLSYLQSLYLVLIFLLLLFVPNTKFKKKWHKYVGIIIVFVLTLVLGKILIALFAPSNVEEIVETVASPSKAVTRIMDLATHPINALLLGYRTLKMKMVFYLRSIVGYFGWFTFHLNDLYVLAYIVFAFYIWRNTNFVKTKWYDKTIAILGIFVGIVGVFLAMYVYWSGPELFYIDGVQGRYFLPIVAPLILLLITSKNKKENPNIKKNTYTFINIVLFEYISLLLLFYY